MFQIEANTSLRKECQKSKGINSEDDAWNINSIICTQRNTNIIEKIKRLDSLCGMMNKESQRDAHVWEGGQYYSG